MILIEASDVFGVSRHFSVAEKVKHLLHVVFYPGLLGVVIAVCIGVVLFSGLLEGVGLSDCLIHYKDLLNASLSICTSKVSFTEEEAHHAVKLGLGIHDQILESDKKERHTSGLCVVHHSQKPVVHVGATIFNPPIEVVWVELFVIEWALQCMVVHRNQVQPRKNRIHGVPHNDNNFVSVKHRSPRHYPGRVRLNNPDSVISNVLTL